MKKILLWVTFTCLVPAIKAQELPGGRQSFALSTAVGPRSNANGIGYAQERRIITAALAYTHSIWTGRSLRIAYEGTVVPFFQESDPTIIGVTVVNPPPPDPSVYLLGRPVRPTTVDNVPLEVTLYQPVFTPQPLMGHYLFGHHEATYGIGANPVGARVNLFRRYRLQPTVGFNLGMLYTTRDVPIGASSLINFVAQGGPGLEVFTRPRNSVRLETIYRHQSNAGLGTQNPGVDNWMIRLTLSRYK